MDNPGQFLIHVSNRGPTVVSSGDGDLSGFKLHTRQPIKDVNKFGLLHYSIPKQIDTVTPGNNYFNLFLAFGDVNGEVQYVTVKVDLPLVDYYSMLISDIRGDSGSYRKGQILSFDELLQTSINWAIQKTYANYNERNTSKWGEVMLNRIGCIVGRDTKTGRLQFSFGYRGHQTIANNDNISTRNYVDGNVLANTGNPLASYDMIDYYGRIVDNVRQITTPTTNYTQGLAPQPLPHLQPANDPLAAQLGGYADDGATQNTVFPSTADLCGVAFEFPIKRIAMMLGSNSDRFGSRVTYNTLTRGRLRLVSYPTGPYTLKANNRTSIVHYDCESRPNLEPPSFMYLNLLVAGTRSKILGQKNERAGWALPTPQEGYMSNYINFLDDAFYDNRNARWLPYINYDSGTVADYWNADAPLDGNQQRQNGRLGFAFDPIPKDAGVLANAAAGTPAKNVINAVRKKADGTTDTVAVYVSDNFQVVDADNNGNPFSQLVFIGIIDEFGNMAPAHKRYERENDYRAIGRANGGFGNGLTRMSSVFTMSMIEPNYIYTQTENITMQTIDLQLLFGDTSELVKGRSPQPCQISLIASP